MSRCLFQSERNATLLIDVLRSNVASGQFKLHDFVIMPDHLHLLITVNEKMTIEKAMQTIKGGFSYRLKKEFGYLGEVWQKGFSEVRVYNDEDLLEFRRYIALNPVKAGLVHAPENYPTASLIWQVKSRQGLKPRFVSERCGMTEVMS